VPLLLRIVRRARWYKSPNVPWLAADEIQADALGDLSTSENKLSLWLVEDEESNLKRIVAALAAARERLANFDYALLDVKLLADLGISCHASDGTSPDTEANRLWHCDLSELTAAKLVQLAGMVHHHAAMKRLTPKDVRSLITDSLQEGRLDRSKLGVHLLSDIGLG
jgi:hypothetical protein